MERLIDRYCEVWGEPDGARRAAMLAEVWAEGGAYTDPTVHAAGAKELLAHIARVLEKRPGAKVVRTSAVDAHHDLARFEWHVVQPDGKVLRRGIDIAVLSGDGKIRRMMGFFL